MKLLGQNLRTNWETSPIFFKTPALPLFWVILTLIMKKIENSYRHRQILNSLKLLQLYISIQVVQESKCEWIYSNSVGTSILYQVYVDDINVVETITIEKQPISDYSLVCVISNEKVKGIKFSEIESQCKKNYSKQKLKWELENIDF